MAGLSFVARSKSDQFQRRVVGADQTAELLWNDTSIAAFTIDDDHPAAGLLTARGARCAVVLDDSELFRGAVVGYAGTGPNAGTLEIHVESDDRKLGHWLVWPKPAAGLTGQDAEYAHYTGTTEAVFKAALQAAITHYGVSWAVAANLNRGPAAVADFRFDALAEKLYPLLVAARLAPKITYSPTPVVDLVASSTLPIALTVDTGVIDSYKYDAHSPDWTRVVIGGRGEGVAREFDGAVDVTRESDWNDIIEVFKDARNVDVGTSLAPQAAQTLAEGAAGVALSMDLTEADRFRFRQHYQLGDVLPVVVQGQSASEVITRISIGDTERDGVTVVPHIGAVAVDPQAQLADRVAALQDRIQQLGKR